MSFGNWVTTSCENMFTPPTRLDKTGQSPIYWKLLKTVENYWKLSPTLFAPPTPTRQNSFVGSESVVWNGLCTMFARCDHWGQLVTTATVTAAVIGQQFRPVLHELNMFNSYDRPCNCLTDYSNWGQSHRPVKWCDTWNMEETLKLIETVTNYNVLWQTDQKEHGRKRSQDARCSCASVVHLLCNANKR